MHFSGSQPYAIVPGAKATLLSELLSAKIPVESGFIIASSVFETFVEHNGIPEFLEQLLKTVSISSPKDLQQIARQLRARILRGEFPEEAASQIASMYLSMGEPQVRLSPSFLTAAEDSQLHTEIDSSFYGYQGDSNLFEGVKEVWSHFFDPKPLFYRIKHGMNHFVIPFSICVQRQAKYKTTAVLYTDDPTSKTKQTLLAKVVFGEGALANDLAGADYYWAKRGSGELYNSLFDIQAERTVFENGHARVIPIPPSQRSRRKLTNAQIVAVSKLAAQLQQYFFSPQEALIGFDGERCLLIETRQFSFANPAIDPKIARQRSKTATPTPPIAPHTLKYIGLRHSLSAANHLPIATTITGHISIDPTNLITATKTRSSSHSERLLAHELTHSLEFLSKHAHTHLGFIYEFSKMADNPDRTQAECTALAALHRTHSALPLTLCVTAQTADSYQRAISLWIQNGFSRSSRIFHANQLNTPAQIYRISAYVEVGMDLAIFDLDALSDAIVGEESPKSHPIEDDAVVDLLKKGLQLCADHGISATIYCTASPTHAMLNAITPILMPEWCTNAKTYTQMASK